MNTLDTVPSDILKYIAEQTLRSNIKALSSLAVSKYIWTQSQPIIFGPLPIIIVKHIITLILRSNIRAVKSLIINRYIWALVDVIWPQIARKSLNIIGPVSVTYERLCVALWPTTIRLRGGHFAIDYSPNKTQAHDSQALVLHVYAQGVYVYVMTCNYVISFIVKDEYYVSVIYQHRRILRHGAVRFDRDINHMSARSRILQQQTKHLLTKIHPTLAPRFIF